MEMDQVDKAVGEDIFKMNFIQNYIMTEDLLYQWLIQVQILTVVNFL